MYYLYEDISFYEESTMHIYKLKGMVLYKTITYTHAMCFAYFIMENLI